MKKKTSNSRRISTGRKRSTQELQRFIVSMPKVQVAELDKISTSCGYSRNQFIVRLLQAGIGMARMQDDVENSDLFTNSFSSIVESAVKKAIVDSGKLNEI